MNQALDTMYYQWVATEEDKKLPTVMEDIEELPTQQKIMDLLEVHANLVMDIAEAEVDHENIFEHYLEKAMEDPEIFSLSEEGELERELEEAISSIEEVHAAEKNVDNSHRAYQLYTNAFAKVLGRE